MDQQDIERTVQLTVEWLKYLDIYQIEGCTDADISYGLGGAASYDLRLKRDRMPVKQWRAVVDQIKQSVNQELYPET